MKIVRQKFFISKELYYSVAIIAVWSLLASIFFIFLASSMYDFIGKAHNIIYFAVILLGYCFFVLMISMIVSHRFIGPFSRLRIELRMALAGKYDHRLHARGGDHLFIKNFLEEINKLLDRNERLSRLVQELPGTITDEISRVSSSLPAGEHHGKLIAVRDRIISMIDKAKE